MVPEFLAFFHFFLGYLEVTYKATRSFLRPPSRDIGKGSRYPGIRPCASIRLSTGVT
jgi:hypothetical protein